MLRPRSRLLLLVVWSALAIHHLAASPLARTAETRAEPESSAVLAIQAIEAIYRESEEELVRLVAPGWMEMVDIGRPQEEVGSAEVLTGEEEAEEELVQPEAGPIYAACNGIGPIGPITIGGIEKSRHIWPEAMLDWVAGHFRWLVVVLFVLLAIAVFALFWLLVLVGVNCCLDEEQAEEQEQDVERQQQQQDLE